MLTFEQALTALKSRQDVRRAGWPRVSFLRVSPLKKLQKYVVSPTLQTTVTAYAVSDEDLFSTDWEIL